MVIAHNKSSVVISFKKKAQWSLEGREMGGKCQKWCSSFVRTRKDLCLFVRVVRCTKNISLDGLHTWYGRLNSIGVRNTLGWTVPYVIFDCRTRRTCVGWYRKIDNLFARVYLGSIASRELIRATVFVAFHSLPWASFSSKFLYIRFLASFSWVWP
jgi:hypothetical protein